MNKILLISTVILLNLVIACASDNNITPEEITDSSTQSPPPAISTSLLTIATCSDCAETYQQAILNAKEETLVETWKCHNSQYIITFSLYNYSEESSLKCRLIGQYSTSKQAYVYLYSLQQKEKCKNNLQERQSQKTTQNICSVESK